MPVMLLRFLVLAPLLGALSLRAQPLRFNELKVGSRVFTNVLVLGANASDLYFTHQGGIANIKLKYLAPDLQQQFHYDPQKAAEAEKQKVLEDAMFQQNLASNFVVQAEQARLAAKTLASPLVSGLADPVSEQSLIGKKAPPLEADKWLGTNAPAQGKFVLTVIWSPSSMACRKSIPELNTLQKKFVDTLTIIGVTSEAALDVETMPEPKPAFPIAFDSSKKFMTAAGVTSIPCAVLADTNGIVLYQGHPAVLNEQRLESVLGKPKDEKDSSGKSAAP